MLPDAGTTTPLRQTQVRFDWEEARRLRAEEKLPFKEIGRRLGVTESAVERVCNLETLRRSRVKGRSAEERERQRERMTAPCPCGRGHYWPYNSTRCRTCADEAQITTVREDSLRCTKCKTWMPDEKFPRNRSQHHRRSRGSECLSCDAARKRESRRRARGVASADGDRDTAPAAR